MKVLPFDLGLNVGWAALERGERPRAGSRRLAGNSGKLGMVIADFHQFAGAVIDAEKPDVIGYASKFVGRMASPASIGPLFGLIAHLEWLAHVRGIRCVEVDEGRARKAFLGAVPGGRKNIKSACMAACRNRNWPAQDDHVADALVVGDFILAILEPENAHAGDPLFATAHS